MREREDRDEYDAA